MRRKKIEKIHTVVYKFTVNALSCHTLQFCDNSLNPGRVTGNLLTHLYRVCALYLTLPLPLRSPKVRLVSMIVRWQKKYWYFPTITKNRRLGNLLKGSALAQHVQGRGFRTQHLKTKKRLIKCSGFFSVAFVFSEFVLFQKLPLGRTYGPAPAAGPGGAGSQLEAAEGTALVRPLPARPRGPRYLDRAPPEAVDGVGIYAGFQELPHRLHLPPRRGGGQARVTAAAQHALVLLSQPRRGVAGMVLRWP